MASALKRAGGHFSIYVPDINKLKWSAGFQNNATTLAVPHTASMPETPLGSLSKCQDQMRTVTRWSCARSGVLGRGRIRLKHLPASITMHFRRRLKAAPIRFDELQRLRPYILVWTAEDRGGFIARRVRGIARLHDPTWPVHGIDRSRRAEAIRAGYCRCRYADAELDWPDR